MKLSKLVLTGVLGVAFMGSPMANEVQDLEEGRKTYPRSPESMMNSTRAGDMAAIADIVRELGQADTQVVMGFIDQLYGLRDKYTEVMQMEVKLQQSASSGADQKELMKTYVRLLQEEKDLARAVIETVKRDLEATESRLLQVLAKIYRIGDRSMKTTISNVRVEIKKNVTYQLHNSQGKERAFYMDALRFLDQYFQ
ncbi:MAG: hypothetical protein H3C47_00495 [Candidatus Cloacimonetes bacterium]|nr:hypothetical protein [Candidatus Cloacimonadota bacterium]